VLIECSRCRAVFSVQDGIAAEGTRFSVQCGRCQAVFDAVAEGEKAGGEPGPEAEPESPAAGPPAAPLVPVVVEPVTPIAPERLPPITDAEPLGTVQRALAGMIVEPERAAARLLQQGAAAARQAFADDKEDPAALRAMTLAESISGSGDQAALHAEQAERAAPGDPWALYAKAAAASASHAHERAVQALSAAREAEPRLLRADVDLAAISLDRGDPAGARELLESVLRRNPKHERARRMLSLVSR